MTEFKLNYYQFLACFPNVPSITAIMWYQEMDSVCKMFNIYSPSRLAMFFAQIGWECNDFRHLEELSDGRLYELRTDLGNMNPGDGPKYKGRGIIQLTGKNNYCAYGHLLNIDLCGYPELASEVPVASKIACMYWVSNGLNELADKNTVDAFKEVTKRINGGYTHLTERIFFWNRNKTVFKIQ